MGKTEKIFAIIVSFFCLFMIFKPVEGYNKDLAGQKRTIKNETERYDSGDEVVLTGNTLESITFETELLETKDGVWIFESDLI